MTDQPAYRRDQGGQKEESAHHMNYKVRYKQGDGYSLIHPLDSWTLARYRQRQRCMMCGAQQFGPNGQPRRQMYVGSEIERKNLPIA